VATVVVSAWEKELDHNKLHAVLRGEVPAVKETETAGA
jgi:aerobic C4-dicarboxylate transport protein